MSAVKEPHFFAPFEFKPQFDNFVAPILDPVEYQNLFRGSEGCKAVGEASPSYLCNPDTPARIRANIDDARIIVSLRNPVERAFSHYLMEFHRGRERLPFPEALTVDDARNPKGWGVSFQYIELSLYASQVNRYLEVFGKDRVLVLMFEDLVNVPEKVMKRVASFLGVNPSGFPSDTFVRAYNMFEASRGPISRRILNNRHVRLWSRRWLPKRIRLALRGNLLVESGARPELNDKIRKALAARFAPDLDRLQSILGQDIAALRENG